MTRLLTAAAFACALALAPHPGAAQEGRASALDSGIQTNASTWECTPGHQVEKRTFTLDSGARRYAFLCSGCVDPSHGEKRPCSEGNFGMPLPISGNWYWCGFMQVYINGEDATAYRIADARVIETGARGAFQITWAHPDADVSLRMMILPGSNHVLADLIWKSRAGAVKTVSVRLVCYPSYFTAPNHRAGARHCQTPRIDLAQPETLQLVPEQDTTLYYYDTTFDVALGEGNGPCAALVAPAGVQGGNVAIGDYAELTTLDLKPEAGEARLGFYDFAGLKNAEAEAYMKAHGAEDLARLIAADFRPQAVRDLNVEAGAVVRHQN